MSPAIALGFEQNVGQVAAPVDFLARGQGYTLYLSPTAATFDLQAPSGSKNLDTGEPLAGTVIQMKLVGANPNATATGRNRQAGISNYLIGSDPSQWHQDVAHVNKVSYAGVYRGIDVVYHADASQRLEYDFVVAPGARPRNIHLTFEGVERVRRDSNGDLILSTPARACRRRL